MRKFTADRIVVASHNKGKVREIAALLSPYGVKAISAAALDLPEPVEDGDSFIENAQLKALSAAENSGLVALADDSGLVVPALGGRPGIHSGRWAVNPETGLRDFNYAMNQLEIELGKIDATKTPDHRSAYFICVLSIAWPDEHVISFEGRVYGTLVWPIRGNNGFGYDPMFRPGDYAVTFGEMEVAKKHAISHRANAFKKLINACFE